MKDSLKIEAGKEQVKISPGPSTPPQLRKRIHDLQGALRSLSFLSEALEKGYRFDDALAPEKIAAVKRAVGILEGECQSWNQVLTLLCDRSVDGSDRSEGRP